MEKSFKNILRIGFFHKFLKWSSRSTLGMFHSEAIIAFLSFVANIG